MTGGQMRFLPAVEMTGVSREKMEGGEAAPVPTVGGISPILSPQCPPQRKLSFRTQRGIYIQTITIFLFFIPNMLKLLDLQNIDDGFWEYL